MKILNRHIKICATVAVVLLLAALGFGGWLFYEGMPGLSVFVFGLLAMISFFWAWAAVEMIDLKKRYEKDTNQR